MFENEKVIVLDTETTNSIDDPIAYDIGFAVIDINGEVYETHSYVVADVFLDRELMASAFFADKIPQYWEDIKNGNRKLRKLKTIKYILADVCKQYGIKKICAYNCRFDVRSLNLTQRFLTNSKYRYFYPYEIQFMDILKLARGILKNDDKYGEFCYNNDYMTKNNQRRYTAEIVYRYLFDENFIESHTGCEDCEIEGKIMIELLKKNKNINFLLWDK